MKGDGNGNCKGSRRRRGARIFDTKKPQIGVRHKHEPCKFMAFSKNRLATVRSPLAPQLNRSVLKGLKVPARGDERKVIGSFSFLAARADGLQRWRRYMYTRGDHP